MASNLLEAPVATLQTVLKPPAPWGFVARHLVSLLKSYSTGLSFQVAADEISVAWKKQCRTAQSRPRVLTGTITHVARGPPEVWLVRLADATEIAVYAHSNYFGTVASGTIVSFAADRLQEPASAQGVVPEQVRLVRGVLRDSSTGTCDAPQGVKTPIANVKGTTSQSPVDVMKFPTKNAQPQNAETPSQVVDPVDPGGTLTRIVMPTPSIFFDLESVSPIALGLSESPQAFSLQRVWNERSLTPNWIYATVVQVEREAETIVSLQDLLMDENADQPSVSWRLSEELKGIAEVLEPGFHVLLRSCLVQPNGNSFDILCSPHTTCYYMTKLNTKCPVTLRRPFLQDITNTGPRNLKRRRTDSDLSMITTDITTKHVAALANPECQAEFATHARVIQAPSRQDANVTTIQCQHGISVRVVGPKMARRAMQTTVGDEILLQGMTYETQSLSGEVRTPRGWIAGCMDNISTMPGVLFSPIVRHLVPLKQCLLSDARTSLTSPTTAHVLVRIRNAVSNSERRELHLSITDCNHVVTSSLTQAIASDVTREAPDDGGTIINQAAEGVSEWNVKVRDNCFEALFWSQMGESSWEDETLGMLVESLPRLRASMWLMTLTMYPSKEARLTEVCACAPCTRSYVVS